MSTDQFLNWIADRIVHVYKESPNVDFVLKLKEIATAMHVSTEQKPTAEALKVAARIVIDYRKAVDAFEDGAEIDPDSDLGVTIATLLTAKDAEIERLRLVWEEAVALPKEIERLKWNLESKSGALEAQQEHHAQLLNELEEAKDAEIESLCDRAIQQTEQNVPVIVRCDNAERERDKLREQNQQQRALLVEALGFVTKSHVALKCGTVDYRVLDAITEFLSTPAVVELLKEVSR